MNEIIASLHRRKSVRLFLSQPLEADVKQALFEAAFQAPTAGNQMLYTILDITDQELKQELAVLCDDQPFIATAPLVLIFLADCQRWLDAYRLAGCAAREPGPGDLMLAIEDAVIAAQNVVVAAESLGLGSCYIGDIMEQCEQARQLLRLPQTVYPAAMLVIGYPDPAGMQGKKPARFGSKYIVQENNYRCLTDEEQRQMFAQRNGKEGFDFDAYIRAFHQRKYDSDFSREMSRSAQVYLDAFCDTGKD